MTPRPLVAFLFLALAACQQDPASQSTNGAGAGAQLDQLAIQKGLLPDPKSRSLAGRFETNSELGTDKFCAVARTAGDYDIGFLAVFGPESKCEGQGSATLEGDMISITLNGKDSCSFSADYDGIVLRFPGVVPEGCASYCSRNASMSGTRYYFVDPGNAAARRTLGREIENLCGNGAD